MNDSSKAMSAISNVIRNRDGSTSDNSVEKASVGARALASHGGHGGSVAVS